MPARLQFDFHPAPAARRPRQGPLRVLLMGDFSGRAAAERPPLATRRIHRLDLDSFDSVMAQLAPRLVLGAETVELATLDDFHPDALCARLPAFAALHSLRQRLQDPSRFAQAAAELGLPATPDGGGDLLAGLLGGRPAAATPPAAPTAAGGIDAFVRRVVAPYIVPAPQPQQAALLGSVDAALGAELRGVLHAPAFQALESAWRGAMWLVSGLELDESLQLHLLDVSRDELLADVVASGGRLAETALHRLLADRWRNVPGGEPWHLLCGLVRFGPSDADVGLAAALGLVASQAGGPFVAGGDLALATAEPAALAGWQALRASEAAPWLGLVAPRLLLRQPYGRRSDPITAFEFEEFPGGAPLHEGLLWGAGSLAATLLLGRAFAAKGWAMEPGDEREIGDLPAYSYTHDGEILLQPCAELLLDDRAGEGLLASGLMPLMSHKHRNAVTLLRFQSIGAAAQPLALATGRD